MRIFIAITILVIMQNMEGQFGWDISLSDGGFVIGVLFLVSFVILILQDIKELEKK